MARRLIRAGADPAIKLEGGEPAAVRRARGRSTASQLGQAMIAAALGNRADVIRDLVAAKVPVDARLPSPIRRPA